MSACKLCGRESREVSDVLGYCAECIRAHYPELREHFTTLHAGAHEPFGLPESPPRSTGGRVCKICANTCSLAEGETGFCGYWENHAGGKGALEPSTGSRQLAYVSCYHDPLPTNCVADWVCPGGAQAGYYNLAVFYECCNFNCLYCQNWHFRASRGRNVMSAQELASCANERTACICYFGGDPTPQVHHALRASRLALKQAQKEGRSLRICWETNGGVSRPLLKNMIHLSLESGGCVKFDLKFASEHLSLAICGVSNRQTFENLAYAASFIPRRPSPPLVVASTLLVPGYVDTHELKEITRFIVAADPEIPYSLLGFAMHFIISDLPTTSRKQANEAREIALEAGLKNVRIANQHLLS